MPARALTGKHLRGVVHKRPVHSCHSPESERLCRESPRSGLQEALQGLSKRAPNVKSRKATENVAFSLLPNPGVGARKNWYSGFARAGESGFRRCRRLCGPLSHAWSFFEPSPLMIEVAAGMRRFCTAASNGF